MRRQNCLSYMVSEDEKKDIQELANKHGRSVSSMSRIVMNEWVKRQREQAQP